MTRNIRFNFCPLLALLFHEASGFTESEEYGFLHVVLTAVSSCILIISVSILWLCVCRGYGFQMVKYKRWMWAIMWTVLCWGFGITWIACLSTTCLDSSRTTQIFTWFSLITSLSAWVSQLVLYCVSFKKYHPGLEEKQTLKSYLKRLKEARPKILFSVECLREIDVRSDDTDETTKFETIVSHIEQDVCIPK